MKRYLCSAIAVITILLTLSGCNIIATETNTIGKSKNSIVTVYEALVENFKLRKKEDYQLYGASMLVNTENVGTFTYVYTDKRPDKLNYSDILIVEINNRTGRIEKFSSPEYSVYEQMPYDVIKTSMPIDPVSFKLDSDDAIKVAAATHQGNHFLYNYIRLNVGYSDGQYIYDVEHISLVYDCIYKTRVNAMTGTVISSSVEDLL